MGRIPLWIGWALWLGWLVPAGGIAASMDQQNPPSLAPVLNKVSKAVVNISTRSRLKPAESSPMLQDPFYQRFFNAPQLPAERDTWSRGSGVIVDADLGYVVTSNHVVSQADEIEVTLLDGRRVKARNLGGDAAVDIALLQIEAQELTGLSLADSDKLLVGDFVVSVGNPFGLGQTATTGIISALSRSGLGIGRYEDYIQTDAAIYPGSSGGALVNLKGELVGINTAIVDPRGNSVGFGLAIPSNLTREVMTQLIEFGEIKRGQLGLHIQSLTPELATMFDLKVKSGIVVVQVDKNSPAQKAGLQSGDVIKAVDNEKISDLAQVQNDLANLALGQEMDLEIVRGNGRHRTVTVVLPKQKRIPGQALHRKLAGTTIGSIGEGHPFFGRLQGAEVVNVDQSSEAWTAGLRPGDIIVSVNREPIETIEDGIRAAKIRRNSMLLNIHRRDHVKFVLIR